MRPRRIIVTVEIVFRMSFCAVPAFSRVEPETTSGADVDRDRVVGDARERAAARADDGDAERAGCARRLERGDACTASSRSR